MNILLDMNLLELLFEVKSRQLLSYDIFVFAWHFVLVYSMFII